MTDAEFEVMKHKVKRLEEHVKGINETINGNGHEGLKYVAMRNSTKLNMLFWFVPITFTLIQFLTPFIRSLKP